MSYQNPTHKFIRARISFNVDNLYHNAGLHPVTLHGVMAFRWTHFDPRDVVGKPTQLAVEIDSAKEPYHFKCNAHFTCEETMKGRYLGLDFVLEDTDRVTLETIISQEGEEITHTRKFPRIPYLDQVKSMPREAVSFSDHMRFALSNLSPAGLQLVAIDPKAENLNPGDFLQLALLPRNSKDLTIKVTGQIRQINHRLNTEKNILERELGVEFAGMSAPELQQYSGLLKRVLSEIKVAE